MRRPSEQEERKRSRSWRGNNFVHRFDWPRRRKARPRCPVTTIFAAREIDSYYATISRLLRTNLLPSGEGGREVVYSPGNASIDRPYLAPATKLIENERALSLSLSGFHVFHPPSYRARFFLGGNAARCCAPFPRNRAEDNATTRGKKKGRKEEGGGERIVERARVARLRGSIFLVVFCCRWATHRDSEQSK